jgi:hypothetical protein
MGLQAEAPVYAKLTDKEGNVTPIWTNWFQLMMDTANRVYVSQPDIYTGDATLITKDFGKLIKFDNDRRMVHCYLPKGNEVDIGGKLSILRLGDGPLRIIASATDTIGNSSLGGGLVCAEPDRKGANVTLILQTSTRWSIDGGLGIWYVV